MTKAQQTKIITTNAAIITIATLLSFVLPLITDSMTEGRSHFLRMLMHVFPLFCAVGFISIFTSKTLGAPTEE